MANVAAGSYVISAKTIVDPVSVSGAYRVTCTLLADSTVLDSAEFSRNDHVTTLPLQGTWTFASTGTILLRCNSTEAADARVTRIMATTTNTVTRDAVTG